jgi:osmotically-inducible protein OsmY
MKTKKPLVYALAAVFALFWMSGSLFPAEKLSSVETLKRNALEAYYRHYQDPINLSVPEPGTIVLKGNVGTYWDKLNIFAVMAKVNGVTKIVNELAVVTDPVPNDIIRDDIMHNYQLNHMILEPKNINVSVDNGLVILRGTISYFREAEAAEDIAGWEKGVVSVDNELNVLPKSKAVSDSNLTDVAMDVLKDEFPLGAENVKASVSQGVVTLTGMVPNYWVKYSIEKEMHSIMGIQGVKDHLTVKLQLE